MFIGEYTYSLDEKRRLSIPAKLRKELGAGAVITRGIDNCLALYSIKEWEKLAEKLQNLPAARGEARGFVRILLSGAVDVKFDKLGRILVPEFLKKYAQLKKNVVIIGLGNRIEIWDKKKWEEYKNRTEAQVGNMAEKLEELGI
jgi:MraZ protein